MRRTLTRALTFVAFAFTWIVVLAVPVHAAVNIFFNTGTNYLEALVLTTALTGVVHGIQLDIKR
jgi:hypothetical protein